MSTRFHRIIAAIVPLAATVAILGPFGPARAADRPAVRIGALAGMGFSKLGGLYSPVVALQQIESACFGISLRVPVGRGFAVEPEVLSVTDGLSFGESHVVDDSGNVLGTVESLHVLDRIQVPVLVRFAPPTRQRVRPFVFAGPFAATRRREYDRMTGSLKSTRTNPLLRWSEYGATVGGGVMTRLGPGALELQGRYDTGLSDLGQYLGIGSPHTRAFRVMLGYD